jgi:hypothetical protein
MELDLQSQFHVSIIDKIDHLVKERTTPMEDLPRDSSPRLKPGASSLVSVTGVYGPPTPEKLVVHNSHAHTRQRRASDI